MSGLESKLQTKIIAYADSIGCYVEKTIIGNTNGLSDVKLCYKGRFITIECKAPGKKPTELQQFKMRKVREAGGITLWGGEFEALKFDLINATKRVEMDLQCIAVYDSKLEKENYHRVFHGWTPHNRGEYF